MKTKVPITATSSVDYIEPGITTSFGGIDIDLATTGRGATIGAG